MIDIGSIAAVVSSLKAAGDITHSMIALRDAEAFQSKAIELNEKLLIAQGRALAAQETLASLAQRISELEQQIADSEGWKREQQRYQLTDHGGGTFTYTLKLGMENGEPSHRLCPHCYQQRQKSILQSRGQIVSAQEKVNCPACKTEFILGHARELPSRTSKPRSHWGA
jgi:hypothetical protein